MNKYKKLIKNVFSIFLGQMGSKLMVYLLLPLYTYVLTPEEYGIFDLISVAISLLIPILSLDIFEACFRFAMDESFDKKQVFSVGIYVCIAATVFVLLLYPVFSLLPSIGEYYFFFFALFAANVLNSFLMQFVKGCQKIKLYSACGVINTVALLTSNLCFLLLFNWGLCGYFAAYVLAHSITNIVILMRVRFWKYLILPQKIEKRNLRAFLKYSVPMMPNSVCWWISNSSDKYMLGYMVSIAAQGIYSVAYKIPSALSVISSIFMSAWSVSAVEDYDSQSSEKMHSNVYSAFMGIVFSATSILILLARPLAMVLYQKEFFVAWKCSVVLLVAFVFNAASAFLGTIYVAAKKTKMLFVSTVIAAVINVGLNIALIPFLNIYGAAIATAVSYFVIWIVRLIHSQTIVSYRTNFILHIFVCVLLLGQVLVLLADVTGALFIASALSLVVIALNMKSVIKFLKNSKKERAI